MTIHKLLSSSGQQKEATVSHQGTTQLSNQPLLKLGLHARPAAEGPAWRRQALHDDLIISGNTSISNNLSSAISHKSGNVLGALDKHWVTEQTDRLWSPSPWLKDAMWCAYTLRTCKVEA